MGHRRFLPHSHPYREYKNHFNGEKELESAPRPLSKEEVYEKVNSFRKKVKVDKEKQKSGGKNKDKGERGWEEKKKGKGFI